MKLNWRRPDAALTAAGVEGEKLVARLRLAVIGLLFVTPLWRLIEHPTVPVFVSGFVVIALGAVAAVAIWAQLRFGQWRRWIGFASSALDVSLVTGALASFAYVSGPLVALNSNVTFETYFLAIAALALRYDVAICVTIGLLAVLEYALLWAALAWRYDLSDPAYAIGVGMHSASDQTSRLILLTAAALLASVYVRRAQRLLHLASRDRLTGLYNRAHFDSTLAVEIDRALQSGEKLSVAVLDLDHFKKVNDTLGHAAGDRVLKDIAARMLAGIRNTDMLARYGGEEFVMLFRGSDRTAAAVRVEMLRAHVAAMPLRVRDGEEVTVTCSAGIAELNADGVDAAALLMRADHRLLAAKRAGRDRAYASEA